MGHVDVKEVNDSHIALYEDQNESSTTHLEIEPFTTLGAFTGLIPYQSPHHAYQCAMGKQAIGAIAFNQLNYIDRLLYLLVYPQQPMLKPNTIDIVGYDNLPAGRNANVAIMGYLEGDIKDALILSRVRVLQCPFPCTCKLITC